MSAADRARRGSGASAPSASAQAFGSKFALAPKSSFGNSSSAPPALRVGEGPAYDTKRPFASQGKASVNLMGTPVNYVAPNAAPPPQPFKGSPLEIPAAVVGFGANILDNIIGAVNPLNQPRDMAWQSQANTELRKRYDAMVSQNVITEGQAKAQFFREFLDKEDMFPSWMRNVIAPGTGGALGAGLSVLGAIGLPFAATNRALAPVFGRLDSFRNATDEELESNEELLTIRNQLQAGEIDDDEAYDDLIAAGFGYTNPQGGGTGILVSGAIEVFADPVNLLSLGTAGLARATAKATLKATTSLADGLGETGVRTLTESLAAKGMAPQGSALVQEALANPATTKQAQAIINDLGGRTKFLLLDAPIITKVGRSVERVLDPMTLFGSGGAAKLTTQQMAHKGAAGVVSGFTAGNYHNVNSAALSELGDEGATALDNGFRRATMQVVAQVGNEQNVTHIVLTKRVAGTQSDVTAAAMDRARALGGDMERRVKDLVTRTRYRVAIRGGGEEGLAEALRKARDRAVAQTIEVTGVGYDQARRFVDRLDEDGLSLLDFQHYGHVSRAFIEARKALPPTASELDQKAIFLAPRQMTKDTVKELKGLLDRQRGMDRIHALIDRYDDLYRIVDPAMDDDDLRKYLKRILPDLMDTAPQALDDISLLSPEFQDFYARFASQGYRIGMRPDDAIRAIRDPETGVIVGAAPWLDVVDEDSARAVAGRLARFNERIFGSISGTSVLRDSEQRFVRITAEAVGLSEASSRAIFREVQKAAEVSSVTPRGLTPGEMWAAMDKVTLPKSVRGKLTRRDMVSLMIEAHEGSLRTVGVTQKFTGMVKTAGQRFSGENPFGFIAERVYPAIRFRLNVHFQIQEAIETPFFLLLRGQIPISDIKKAMTKEGREELVERTRKTHEMMTRLIGRDDWTLGDVSEQSGLYLAGRRAVSESMRKRSLLSRAGSKVPSVYGIKEYGVARAYENRLSKMMAASMQSDISPQSWDNYVFWMKQRHNSPSQDHAVVQMWWDLQAKQDPDSVYSRMGPDAFTSEHVGDEARVSADLVKFATLGDGHTNTTLRQFRERLADPKDTLDVQTVVDSLDAMGATPHYIERAVYLVTGATPNQYWKALRDLGAPQEEVDRLRGWVQDRAAQRNWSEAEWLTRTFADPPATLDSLGQHTGRTMYQRLSDSARHAGLDVPELDDPGLVAMTDYANTLRPIFDAPPADLPAGARTKAQEKRAGWDRAREARTVEQSDYDAGVRSPLGSPEEVPLKPVRGKYVDGKWVDLKGKVNADIIEIKDAKGRVVGRLRTSTVDEWKDEVTNTFTDEELMQVPFLYDTIRQNIYAIAKSDPEKAARMLLGFTLTQTSTDPIQGMSQMFTAIARVANGEELPAGFTFNDEAFRTFMRENNISDEGIGQKLVDFIDASLGMNTRSLPIHGPRVGQAWGPIPVDVHVKRDGGHIDNLMADHLRRAWGAQTVEFDDELGYLVDMGGGETFRIPRDQIGKRDPTDLEYDWAQETYNEYLTDLNNTSFLGRNNWTAGQVQTLAWFKAQRTFGDEGKSALDTLMGSVRETYHEVIPAPGSSYARVYPGRKELTKAQRKAITSDLGQYLDIEVEEVLGAVLFGGTKHTYRMLPNGEVVSATAARTMGDRSVATAASKVRSYLTQQPEVPATRLAIPSAQAGASVADPKRLHLWAMDWTQEGMTKAQAESALNKAAKTKFGKANGVHVVQYDDGSWGVRSLWQEDDFWARAESNKGRVGKKARREAYPDSELENIGDAVPEWSVVESTSDPRPKPAVDAERMPGVPDGVPSSANPFDHAEQKLVAAWRTDRGEQGMLVRGEVEMVDPRTLIPEYRRPAAEGTVGAEEVVGGVREPIDITPGGRVMDGHNRMESAIEAGLTEVPVYRWSWAQPEDENLKWLRENGYAKAAERLELGGRSRAGLAYERTYRKHAAAVTERYRSVGDLSDPAGPGARPTGRGPDDGTLGRYAASTAIDPTPGLDAGRIRAAAAADQPLWHRTGKGTLGATVISTADRRARIFLKKGKFDLDTVLHEFVHQFGEELSPSARAQVLDAFNASVGRPGKARVTAGGPPKAVVTAWDTDVEEWFANQMVEYVRTGVPPRKELGPLFSFYGKHITKTLRRGELQPELKTTLDDILSASVEPDYAYNVDEANLLDTMMAVSGMAARNARDLVHFRTDRSWLERSLNHPFFGLYPLSYMWGKVLPEMVEFLVFRPFGVPAPLVALNTVHNVYQAVMEQQAYDPELRTYLADNEPALRAIAMLVPGIPWDLPVNTPLGLRRLSEAVATQQQRVLDGKKNPDGTPASVDLTKIDVVGIASDMLNYHFNPAMAVERTTDTIGGFGAVAGMAASAVNDTVLESTPDARTMENVRLTTETPAAPVAPPMP